MRAELCCDALTMALGRRGPVPGLIHHSDRGQPVRRWRVSQADQKGEAYPIYEPQGPVPGQRTNGKLLCFTEKGTGSPATVQNTGRSQGRNLPVHRGFLQSPEASLRDRISNAATRVQQYDLENGRIGSMVKLSGNRDELRISTCVFHIHTELPNIIFVSQYDCFASKYWYLFCLYHCYEV